MAYKRQPLGCLMQWCKKITALYIKKFTKGGHDLKKNIALIFALVMTITIFSVKISAADTAAPNNAFISNVNAEINENRQIAISGCISSGAGKTITVMVMDPEGKLEHLDGTLSGKDGRFVFTYTLLNNKAGKHNVTIGANCISDIVRTSFEYGTDDSLKSLLISGCSFDKAFSPDITSYNATVDVRVGNVVLTPEANDKSAVVKVNGKVVKNDQKSDLIDLKPENNIINISVTALSGTSKIYTVTVKKLQAVVSLVTANASIDINKKVTVSGAISSGDGQQVTVVITDPKGKTELVDSTVSKNGGKYELSYVMANNLKGRYTVTVGAVGMSKPAGTFFDCGTDAGLKTIEVIGKQITPDFNPNTSAYKLEVNNSTSSIKIKAVSNDEKANIRINGKNNVSGMESEPIDIKAGRNIISIQVTAQDGVTVKNYSLDVEKGTLSGTKVTVYAGIDKNRIVTVSGNVSTGAGQQATVLITDPNNEIEYIGSAISDVHGNYKVAYTIRNKAAGKYNVAVNAEGADFPVTAYFIYDMSNADLKNLTVKNAGIKPKFAPDITEYSGKAAYNVSYMSVIPEGNNDDQTIRVNGKIVKSGENSENIKLYDGFNTTTVDVTSEDGTKTKTYSINIEKEKFTPPAKSSNADLSSLLVKGAKLEEPSEFNPEIVSYKASADENTKDVTVTPMASDSSATITVNGEAVASGSESQEITVVDDKDTVIEIKVTAEDGTVKTYKVTVRVKKKIPKSSDASLKDLTLSSGKFVDPGEFRTDITEYYACVTTDCSIKVTPTVNEAHASVTVNGEAVQSGSESQEIAVAHDKDTVVEIKVTAEDGTAKTYKVTVRVHEPDLELQNIQFFSPVGGNPFAELNKNSESGMEGFDFEKDPFDESGYLVGVEGRFIPGCDLKMRAEQCDPFANISVSCNGNIIRINKDGTYTIPLDYSSDDEKYTKVTISVFADGGTESVYNVKLGDYLNNDVYIKTATLPADYIPAQKTDHGAVNEYKVQIENNVKKVQLAISGIQDSKENEGEVIHAHYFKKTEDDIIIPYDLTAMRIGKDGSFESSTDINYAETDPFDIIDGCNVIYVDVIPPGWGDKKPYRYNIVLERKSQSYSNNADLSSLLITGAKLEEPSEFNTQITEYKAITDKDAKSVTVTPAVSEEHAMVTVNGEAVQSGSESQKIAIADDKDTVIEIKVTAEDGTVKTYKVTVRVKKEIPKSSDASLKDLTLSSGKFVDPGEFRTDITEYYACVTTDCSINVTPTVNEAHASVTVNDEAVASGSESQGIAVASDKDTVIEIKVTAEDGTVKTYKVTVRVKKEEPESNDAGLEDLTLNSN